DTEPTPELTAALEEFSGAIVPTVKLESVASAYWCRMGAREFLRWSRTEEEESLLDALARLRAAGTSALDEGAKVIGAFRSCGLVIPVWELAPGTEAEELEAPAPDFEERLTEALAVTAALTADERRARAGIVSRQVTLRSEAIGRNREPGAGRRSAEPAACAPAPHARHHADAGAAPRPGHDAGRCRDPGQGRGGPDRRHRAGGAGHPARGPGAGGRRRQRG